MFRWNEDAEDKLFRIQQKFSLRRRFMRVALLWVPLTYAAAIWTYPQIGTYFRSGATSLAYQQPVAEQVVMHDVAQPYQGYYATRHQPLAPPETPDPIAPKRVPEIVEKVRLTKERILGEQPKDPLLAETEDYIPRPQPASYDAGWTAGQEAEYQHLRQRHQPNQAVRAIPMPEKTAGASTRPTLWDGLVDFVTGDEGEQIDIN